MMHIYQTIGHHHSPGYQVTVIAVKTRYFAEGSSYRVRELVLDILRSKFWKHEWCRRKRQIWSWI